MQLTISSKLKMRAKTMSSSWEYIPVKFKSHFLLPGDVGSHHQTQQLS